MNGFPNRVDETGDFESDPQRIFAVLISIQLHADADAVGNRRRQFRSLPLNEVVVDVPRDVRVWRDRVDVDVALDFQSARLFRFGHDHVLVARKRGSVHVTRGDDFAHERR